MVTLKCKKRVLVAIEYCPALSWGGKKQLPGSCFRWWKVPIFPTTKESGLKKVRVEQWNRLLNSHWNSQELFPWCWCELDPDLKQPDKMIRAAWHCVLQWSGTSGTGHSLRVSSSYSPGQNPPEKMRSSVSRTLTWTQLCLCLCPNCGCISWKTSLGQQSLPFQARKQS